MSEAAMVKDGQVVSMDYILIVGEKVLDASAAGQPLQFIQGSGMIIPGLERELYGLAVGDTKEVQVAPRDGYGELDPNSQIMVDRKRFPPNMQVEIGLTVQMRNQDGGVQNARIVEINPQSVKLDFNHPLAGQSLNFAIKIVALRDATPEELKHRHIH
jgi:FKBP-type peptidyl-prolyl cis-trans isomerase SlyD